MEAEKIFPSKPSLILSVPVTQKTPEWICEPESNGEGSGSETDSESESSGSESTVTDFVRRLLLLSELGTAGGTTGILYQGGL